MYVFSIINAFNTQTLIDTKYVKLNVSIKYIKLIYTIITSYRKTIDM